MKFIGKIAFFSALVIFAIALSGCNMENINGTLEIRTVDSEKNSIPGVEVAVINALSGTSTSITTDSAGTASLELAPGKYAISGKYNGEKTSAEAEVKTNTITKAFLKFTGAYPTPVPSEVNAKLNEEFSLLKGQTAIIQTITGRNPIYATLEEISENSASVTAVEMGGSSLQKLTIRVNDFNIIQGNYYYTLKLSKTDGKTATLLLTEYTIVRG